MSSIAKLNKYLKMYGGVGSKMSWSGCSTSSSAASSSSSSSISLPSSNGDLSSLDQRLNPESSASSTGSTATGQSDNTASSYDPEKEEINAALEELIEEKNKAYAKVTKLIKLLSARVSPLLLNLKLKCATCSASRDSIYKLVASYPSLKQIVETPLDCFDEYALYILAGMAYINTKSNDQNYMKDPFLLDLVKKTPFWPFFETRIKEAVVHSGNIAEIENIIMMSLNSAAVSIMNKQNYKLPKGAENVTAVFLFAEISKILANNPTIQTRIDSISKGQIPTAGGARKKHLKKTQKK